MKKTASDPVCEGGNTVFTLSGVDSITIPESVKTIESYAFSGCSGVTTLDLNKVESIGNNAFEYCYNLRSIIIPNSVIKIGGSAFRGCTSLKSVIILDKVIIKNIFINSLGCIPKPPIPNQLLLPFLTVPTPGINTKINKNKQNTNAEFL